jgi:hypothetical protein
MPGNTVYIKGVNVVEVFFAACYYAKAQKQG